MAVEEETWRPGAGRWWNASRAAEYVKNIATPGRLASGLTFGFFLVTLLVYYFTNSGAAVHNHPVRLADAFLHGRLDIPNGKDLIGFLDFAIYNGKYYPLEPPGTAIVILPGVAIFGPEINQTLVSVVIGAITAGAVYQLTRRLTESVAQQVWLTAMFSFGTVYWWNATFAGVWYFNHAVAVLFLFFAVYETLASKRPLTAGLALGAAYITRLPTIMSFPFFAIMFAQWRPSSEGKPLWRRIDYLPLLQLAVGVGIFVLGLAILTYVRFDDLRPSASYYHWHAYADLTKPGGTLENGLFDITYVSRHVDVFFEKPLYMQAGAPYVLPSWGGAAFWATTPAFLYAFLAAIKKRWIRLVGGAAMVLSIALVSILPNLGRGPHSYPWFDWAQWNIPYHLNLLPFLLLMVYSLYLGIRGNKLVLACWAAIIAMVPVHFTVGVTGWPEFGYRYLLDYVPFVFLLTWQGMGTKLKWYHVALIIVGIVINLCGVLWVNKFDPNGVAGIRWVDW